MTDPKRVFKRERIGLPVDETGDPNSAFRICAGPPRKYSSLVHREIPRPLRFDLIVPPISLVSVTGSRDEKVTIGVWVELIETTTADMFASVRLTGERGAVSLTGLPTLAVPPTLHWDLIVPSRIPLSVAGKHAAVDVFGVSGPIEVAAGHGRVSVLECGPEVKVKAGESGSILFSGGPHGTIDLIADAQIKLRLATAQFAGKIEAIAREAIDIYFPVEFESAFRVEVPAADKLVCDDVTRARLKKVNGVSRPAFESGAEPTARFVSLEGKLAIHRYNAD